MVSSTSLLPRTKFHALHRASGIIIAVFTALHLGNHLFALISIERHIEVMRLLRLVYRNPIVETALILAVLVQISTGILLVRRVGVRGLPMFERLRVFSGLYLAFFLVVHVSAVMLLGRLMLSLETNFYFAAAGLNTFPLNLFFIPYYTMAICSVFTHIACVHRSKIGVSIGFTKATVHARFIIGVGVVLAILIVLAFTGRFYTMTIPPEFGALMGR